MVGEALRTKGRNPIELRGIKRRRGSQEGTTTERGDREKSKEETKN